MSAPVLDVIGGIEALQAVGPVSQLTTSRGSTDELLSGPSDGQEALAIFVPPIGCFVVCRLVRRFYLDEHEQPRVEISTALCAADKWGGNGLFIDGYPITNTASFSDISLQALLGDQPEVDPHQGRRRLEIQEQAVGGFSGLITVRNVTDNRGRPSVSRGPILVQKIRRSS